MRRVFYAAVIFPLLIGCGRSVNQETETVRVSSEPTKPVMAVSFNIRYGTASDGPDHWDHRRAFVLDLLAGYGADVIGLQEALAFQVDQVQTVLPEYELIVACRDVGRRRGEGCPIFYRRDRYERLEGGTFWFSETPDVPGSKHWGNTLPRICTWVTLRDRVAGTVLTVFNVHLDHRSQASREKSTELLAERIAGLPAGQPVVVMGDFNIGTDNPAMPRLLADRGGPGHRRLLDTWEAAGSDLEESGTFHGFRGEAQATKIDHILVSEGVEILDAGIDRRSFEGRWPSDHFPVFARIRLYPDAQHSNPF